MDGVRPHMTVEKGMPKKRHADDVVLGVLAALARGALGDAYEGGVAQTMLGRISHLPPADRKQLLQALRALDTRAGALALTGRPTPVSWLTPTSAEALIQRWRASRIAATRRLGVTATALALSSLYGTSTKQWTRLGYPGPLGPAPDEPKRLAPVEIEPGEELRCDVVIVGSGAGGGCVAGSLAQAGLDVVVLEKGGYNSESDFHHRELESTNDMYLYGGLLTTTDLSVQIIAGSTLGGGTVVNYTTSFRTPKRVLEQWTSVSGIDAFVSGEFEESLDQVSARLGVNTDSSAAGKRDELMEEGLKQLGWHVDMMPRAVRGCTQDEACGYCGFGCRVGGKQSTMRTYLEDAAAAGARMIVGADVRRVLIEDGRAVGVVGTRAGLPFTVKARAVVSAAGAIETPALLLRSKLGGQVGHHLRLHPGSATFAVFDEDVRIWEGTLQARYSNELRARDDGYGPIFETVPVHPGSGAIAVPWLSSSHHYGFMANYSKLGFCAVLPRDRAAGRVKVARDGTPRIDYNLTPDDDRRVIDGVIAGAKVMEAAGAKSVFSTHPQMFSYDVGRPGAHDAWASQIRATGYRSTTGFSFHQMGSCRMGTSPATSAIDADNQTHEVADLFVVDGSAFPTASGVNPMLSIYGIANRAAKRIAARLT